MFREMRRFGQQLSDEQCRQVLTQQKRGVLALLGDEGYPYTVPLDFWYDPSRQRICFHCAKVGHKIDAIAACDKASFCVYDEGHTEGDWSLFFNSVVSFGRVRVVDDPDDVIEIARQIGLKFYPAAEEVEEEIAKAANRLAAIELSIEHLAGKRVHEQ